MRSICVLALFFLSIAFGQVRSGQASDEDLNAYFYGGLNVVELKGNALSEGLLYQLIDLRSMSLIEEGDDSPFGVGSNARFVISAATFRAGGDFCARGLLESAGVTKPWVQLSVEVNHRGIFSTSSSGVSQDQCISYREFNWGHWTQLLQTDDALAVNRWIPITAFVPNVWNGEKEEYLSADKWLVLLVQLDGGDLEAELKKEQILERISDLGISLNP